MKIGYLGPPGTYSERAAMNFAQERGNLIPGLSIAHVLEGVLKKELDLAVVPVENSIEGAVTITLDMLASEELFIKTELRLEISHTLVSRERTLGEIKRVYSHPQALGQCRRFLLEELPVAEWSPVESTTAGIDFLERKKGSAAIVPAWTAAEGNFELVVGGIADYDLNQTRFLVLSGQKEDNPEADKTSLCLALPKNKPGGLYEVLGVFVRAGIDLSKIESRPAKKELGDYLFFIDARANLQTEGCSVLEEIKEKSIFLKVLGSYREA